MIAYNLDAFSVAECYRKSVGQGKIRGGNFASPFHFYASCHFATATGFRVHFNKDYLLRERFNNNFEMRVILYGLSR